jgi:hypothetical protein
VTQKGLIGSEPIRPFLLTCGWQTPLTIVQFWIESDGHAGSFPISFAAILALAIDLHVSSITQQQQLFERYNKY